MILFDFNNKYEKKSFDLYSYSNVWIESQSSVSLKSLLTTNILACTYQGIKKYI